MSRLAELHAELASLMARVAEVHQAIAAELGGAPALPASRQTSAPKRRPRVPPLRVCEDAPVDELAAKCAAKALARYQR